MKPDGWDNWHLGKKQTYAFGLLGSDRGRYVIAQALHYAIKSMKEDDPEQRSAIEDMQILQVVFDRPVVDKYEVKSLMQRVIREKVKEGEEQQALEEDST